MMIFVNNLLNSSFLITKGKFIDWPNQTNNPSLKKLNYNAVLKVSEEANAKKISNTESDSKNLFNFEAISESALSLLIRQRDEMPVNLILETSSLGRGRHWFDEIERRSYDIVTEKVHMWKIQNNELIECDFNSHGELYSSFTYVVKWHYKVNAVGFRALKGGLSQHQGITGRDRYALFFWHGENSSQLEKGSGALLSLELSTSISNIAGNISPTEADNVPSNSLFGNEKRSMPHIQVYQHKEIAAFCSLFNGSMIIYSNENNFNSNAWRMFEVRGELEEESHLIEIKQVRSENLRSRTSFLFLNSSVSTFYIWHGCTSSELHKKLIHLCAIKLLKRLVFFVKTNLLFKLKHLNFLYDFFLETFLNLIQMKSKSKK